MCDTGNVARDPSNAEQVRRFMRFFASRVQGEGRVYLTGGASAVLYGWRDLTVDVDIKIDPEPRGAFEAIARVKEALSMNIELAAPDDFIPPLPSWRERSVFIASMRESRSRVEFLHYDFYAQALAKIERGHEQDLQDVAAMRERNLIKPSRLMEFFEQIEPELLRYPALNSSDFRSQTEAMVTCLEAVRNSNTHPASGATIDPAA